MKTIYTLLLFALAIPLSPAVAQSPKDSPDFFFRVASESLKRQRPDVILKAMPAKYHRDIQSVIQTFATNIDADLFNQGTAMIKDVVGILDTKRDIIMGSEMYKGMAEQAGADANDKAGWNDGVALTKSLVNSDLMDLDALKKADISSFLAEDGAKIIQALDNIDEKKNPGVAEMKTAFNEIKNAEYRVLSQNGDEAEVEVKIGGEVVATETMVKVDGYWLPPQMAPASWNMMIGEMKEGMKDLSGPDFQESKLMIMGMMGMANGVIGQFKSAKTSADIDKALGGIMGMMGMGGGFDGGDGDADFGDPEGAFDLEFKDGDDLPPGFFDGLE